ncbi:MAG: hypothetical protein J0H88_08850 [Sphingomonadales bacterium]|uniref:hypothetical protein n=1 Tax=Sphingopyxis sp. TaxID=1908224 RepID=UPI001AC44061|nr:hypothetical protein [Sphingomonadales bacterium]HEV7311879.1 hypothetical protein [Sphingopyxis sp.]
MTIFGGQASPTAWRIVVVTLRGDGLRSGTVDAVNPSTGNKASLLFEGHDDLSVDGREYCRAVMQGQNR